MFEAVLEYFGDGGTDRFPLEATTMEEAIKEVSNYPDEDYDENIIECYGSDIVVSCDIIETNFIQSFDFLELHQKRVKQRNAAEKIDECKKDKEKRRKQYDDLKLEFENE